MKTAPMDVNVPVFCSGVIESRDVGWHVSGTPLATIERPFRYRAIFSARQHICYSALYAIARPSVRLSVRHTGGSVKDV